MNNFGEEIKISLNKIKTENPMVHHITNFVTMQDCANITVAVGASPVMAYYKNEVGEITFAAKSLVLNTGTPDKGRIKAVINAGVAANNKNIPVVLDPVGVGATDFRQKSIEKILREVKPAVIKGNVSEIKFLAGLDIIKKGVDAGDKFESDLKEIFKNLAKKLQAVIIVTGEQDYITDGIRSCTISRGTKMFRSISGAGCMTSSVVGSFLAVENDSFLAAVYGVYTMNVCGELAEKALAQNEGAGTFKVKLFDEIYSLYKIENLVEDGVLFE